MEEGPTEDFPQLDIFNDNFVETWLGDDAKIPLNMWNVHAEDEKRTNNHVEGWNLTFTKLVGKHHSNNIFECVEATRKLKLAQHDAAIPPPPPQKKRKYWIVNQRLAQFKQEYVMGDISVLSFLLAAGHLLKSE